MIKVKIVKRKYLRKTFLKVSVEMDYRYKNGVYEDELGD